MGRSGSSGGPGRRAPQEPEEERAANDRGEDPDREFGRRRQSACPEIGQDKKHGAKQHSAGQNKAVQTAEQKTRHVRSDQADEADGAGKGRGCPDQQGGGHDDLAAHPDDRHPKMRGLLLTELQSIEGPRIPPEEHPANGEEDEEDDHLGPLG